MYRAEDAKHGRSVAIKVLRPELGLVLGSDRFLQEIRTTAALQHPHILPLLDSGETGGHVSYVMPLVEGETIRLLREIADALQCWRATPRSPAPRAPR